MLEAEQRKNTGGALQPSGALCSFQSFLVVSLSGGTRRVREVGPYASGCTACSLPHLSS